MALDASFTDAAGRLDTVLLESTLSIPDVRPGTVSRAGLVVAARTKARRFVGITAPAGYRKSTLLAEWAASESRPVAWVSLDRFDNDPVTLDVARDPPGVEPLG